MTNDTPAMIGIGNDIIEIDRIRNSLAQHTERMLERIFTPKEQEYCLQYKDPIPRFAGKFSAKEAIAKALGTGIGEKLSWHDIEILNEPSGKPYVLLSKRAQRQFPAMQILISISHCELYVSSVAIIYHTEKGKA